MTEDDLQTSVAEYLDVHPKTRDHWWHTPNGGQRHVRVAAKLKSHGVKPGVPDCLIIRPFECYQEDGDALGRVSRRWMNGLAIELKVGKNKPTPSQLKWHKTLRDCGWAAEVCYTLDEVMELVEECYGKPNEQ